MKKLPKGSLKVISINPEACAENERRGRAAGTPRRLVHPVTVKHGKSTSTGFEVRITGETRVRYAFKPNQHMVIETKEAIELAESIGEFDQPVTPEENPNG